jgi:putative tryptophan/tyrosine transport system substrate-binding protein
MKRREFISMLGGATAAWPLAVHAQQAATPVIGFLNEESSDLFADRAHAFTEGLREAGYFEGQNVRIEYRWADGESARLQELTTELIRRQVTVIIATSTPSVLAVKVVNATIPVVFYTALDPVKLGIVRSLSRPGGSFTGVTSLGAEVGAKRLEVLHELMPSTTVFALLVDPASPAIADSQSSELRTAARALGVQLHVLYASTQDELDAAFASMAQLRAGGLVISPGGLFVSRSQQLADLALRHAVPTVFQFREFAAAGGLMSYGGSKTDPYRLIGVYTSRILRGEKPANLPVQQSTKVELVINLKTAKALSLTVPPTLLARADEVIE